MLQHEDCVAFPVSTCIDTATFQVGAKHTAMLDLLVEAGADVNAHCPLSDPFVTDMACTPLAAAINLISQDPKDAAVLEPIVLRLIELGADLDARTHRQQRPLDLASLLPTLTVFKALIAKGADPSPVAFVAFEQSVGREEQLGGCHHLEIAVERDRVDVLAAAAAAGVRLKKVRSMGLFATPLLAMCIRHESSKCIAYLRDYGVDVNEVVCVFGNASQTALELAMMRGNDKIVKQLRAAGGKTREELEGST